ncbi:MAG: DUF721 domain-containing protein [Candidatus Omnitrophica bacterium]|nr:DUF721 domain-containing protein [Candidatus Omnitrophota bacterium]
MEQIKSILNDVINNILKKQQQNPEGDIESIWIRCVRKNVAQHTKTRFFKKGKLYINVENPAWLYELNMKKEDILKRLQKLSKNRIMDVRFKVGNMHGNRK